MKRLFLFIILACSAIAAESRGPFYDPVTGFSDSLIPILSKFEKSRIETTLRGFVARADSFPGFSKSEMEPSEVGLYLNVAVKDVSDIEGFSDRTEQKGTVTRRLVQIPPPKGGGQALVILLEHGQTAPAEVIRAIDKSIRGVIEFSKKRTK